MRKLFSSAFLLVFLTLKLSAQTAPDFQIHSHNDYLQKVPFWTAYHAGASSIEVDVILKDGRLMVAHEPESTNPSRTLESLYLTPILQGLKSGIISSLDFHLLVDLKTEAYSTLEVLEKSLEGYQDILYGPSNPTGLKLVISGNRPKPSDYGKYPDWMLFDYQSLDLNKDLPWEKIGMVSLSFRQFSVWNGKGGIVEAEKQRVQDFIDRVHSFGKPVRFWASPDSKSAWRTFREMGVDYINTDVPVEAANYLKTLSVNVYQNTSFHLVYQPKFEVDGAHVPVKNIILMIGDGNGLAQISAALFAHQNELNLTQIKNMGLVKTQAANDFTTDSAAGATAYATGKKTNNRALGVGPGGERLKNLPELLHEIGFSSGIITTDQLTGATPASFYAHHPERDDNSEIAAFLAESKLDLFIGGGGVVFSGEKENLQSAGFLLAETLENLEGDRAGYFAAQGSLPKVLEGRGDYLAQSTRKGLEFLVQKGRPFFLMVEAASIDSGGHANSSSMTVSEMLDFDQTIGEVLRFADTHPGTLVLITADHETGGVSIPKGDVSNHAVELAYHSDDHTGILVPIFAYGAQSGEFRGVYENTEVFLKLMRLVNQ